MTLRVWVLLFPGQVLARIVRDSEQLSAGNSVVRWCFGGTGHILE